jgi:putative PIN family toxin of toxin-antitoxin system
VPLRIVIDNNVLVSAALKRGGPPDILMRRWLAEDFLLVTSPAILVELADVLNRPKIRDKYRLASEDITELLQRLQQQAVILPGTSLCGIIAADPKDDMFIACAVEGQARYIVSGDHHLLDLRRYGRVRIVTVTHFLQVLERLKRWQ